jgi:hypothetical protein
MTIIPLQFFGIGDVVFTITLIKRIANGRNILWPVMSHFVEGLQRAYPDITFVDYKNVPVNYELKHQCVVTLPNIGDCTIIPIRWADSIMKVPYTHCMRAKYDMYGMDYRDWKESAMWKRDIDIEQMFWIKLGLSPFVDYTLINEIFGSDSQLKANIPMTPNAIKMQTIEGFSLMDWAFIIQNSTAIHTVSTSILFLLELLDLKCIPHLYDRHPIEKGFKNVDYLFTKPYILHQS